ncbi:pyridoxal-phosphate dependent enzyme [Mycobacterium sp. KBS0706]|uniref:threonine ammonia-lyase n=1 Tax=Mycobacterium sp. KBS0706 TaxID=2578109 RepID=UPI00110F7E4E|nr:pyridoxal-phosphate dependent enzyme [Mycobacterium sp. KBS0706]TSD86397.1 pyridoxal-phosphate dependent enzyme [Mycobacterium sp. KBS0706]
MIGFRDIEAAAGRIRGHVRRTPLVRADQLLQAPTAAPLWLKLECLQVTGSFKARGATNRLLAADPASLARGIVTASGGNHGLAVARAGHLARVTTTVFLPGNASPAKRTKLAGWGAEVRIEGTVWDESDRAARAFAEQTGAVYFHPFADPEVVAGQGTVALEIAEDLPEASLFLIAIGGGGLAAGMATAIRALQPKARIIGIEPVGSPTLQASLQAGQVVTLGAVTTAVPTMACGRTDPRVFDIIRRTVDEVVLIEDRDMERAARWLWFELGLAADLSGAASVAALQSGRVVPRDGDVVCGLVCGAGSDGLAA